jgi:hypothetical protein
MWAHFVGVAVAVGVEMEMGIEEWKAMMIDDDDDEWRTGALNWLHGHGIDRPAERAHHASHANPLLFFSLHFFKSRVIMQWLNILTLTSLVLSYAHLLLLVCKNILRFIFASQLFSLTIIPSFFCDVARFVLWLHAWMEECRQSPRWARIYISPAPIRFTLSLFVNCKPIAAEQARSCRMQCDRRNRAPIRKKAEGAKDNLFVAYV